MTEPFRIRRATAADSRRCFDVFLDSVHDLTVRQNVAWDREPETLWAKLRYLLDRLARSRAVGFAFVGPGGTGPIAAGWHRSCGERAT